MTIQRDFARTLHQEIKKFLSKNADSAIVEKYARYFREGYDAYGIDREKLQNKTEEWFRVCRDKLTPKEIINLSERLLQSGKYEEKSIALNFTVRLKDQYNKQLFNTMGKWFGKYIDNWAHCDWACHDILYNFVTDKIVSLKELFEWTKSPYKWKRRAVPVTMVKVVSKQNKIKESLEAAKKLILDPEKVVHQGVGWLLRETWKKAPKEVEDFLYQWKDKAPRLIIQYATEKIPKEKRKKFRRS